MKNLIALCLTSTLLVGCATTQIPVTRKLTAENRANVTDIDVKLIKADKGIGAAWTSHAEAAYNSPAATSSGLVGVLGAAIATAILDVYPYARATGSAREINAHLDKPALDDDLKTKLQLAMSSSDMDFNKVELVERVDKKDTDAGLVVVTNYTLAEDSSAMKITADVRYIIETPYISPYEFEGSVPKAETRGPLYRNRFTYHSDMIKTPELNEAVKADITAALGSLYEAEKRAAVSEEPNEKAVEKRMSKFEKQHLKALEKASDDTLSKAEISVLLTDKWHNDDGLLKHTLADGHKFLADMIIADLSDEDIPQFERKEPIDMAEVKLTQQAGFGPLALVETSLVDSAPSGRGVYKVESGLEAGEYYSIPKDGMAPYGNSVRFTKD